MDDQPTNQALTCLPQQDTLGFKLMRYSFDTPEAELQWKCPTQRPRLNDENEAF
jgi:hypothetical protein